MLSLSAVWSASREFADGFLLAQALSPASTPTASCCLADARQHEVHARDVHWTTQGVSDRVARVQALAPRLRPAPAIDATTPARVLSLLLPRVAPTVAQPLQHLAREPRRGFKPDPALAAYLAKHSAPQHPDVDAAASPDQRHCQNRGRIHLNAIDDLTPEQLESPQPPAASDPWLGAAIACSVPGARLIALGQLLLGAEEAEPAIDPQDASRRRVGWQLAQLCPIKGTP